MLQLVEKLPMIDDYERIERLSTYNLPLHARHRVTRNRLCRIAASNRYAYPSVMTDHATRIKAEAPEPYAAVADHRQDLDQYPTTYLGEPLPCHVRHHAVYRFSIKSLQNDRPRASNLSRRKHSDISSQVLAHAFKSLEKWQGRLGDITCTSS